MLVYDSVKGVVFPVFVILSGDGPEYIVAPNGSEVSVQCMVVQPQILKVMINVKRIK